MINTILLIRNFKGVFPNVNNSLKFSTSDALAGIMTMTRCRVVDNSALGKQAMLEGKPPKCIHVYKKCRPRTRASATIGDKILVTVKGQMKKAIVVGEKQKQRPLIPRFDTNNIVLINDDGSPLGTRILVPIPSLLRGKGEYSKIIAIATKFV